MATHRLTILQLVMNTDIRCHDSSSFHNTRKEEVLHTLFSGILSRIRQDLPERARCLLISDGLILPASLLSAYFCRTVCLVPSMAISENATQARVSYVHWQSNNIPFTRESYHVVICLFMASALSSVWQVQACIPVVKRGGFLLLYNGLNPGTSPELNELPGLKAVVHKDTEYLMPSEEPNFYCYQKE